MRTLALTLAIAVVAAPLAAQRRDCRPTTHPQALPAAGALIDSAGAIASLASLSRGDRVMQFSLIFHDDDSLPTVRPMDKGDALGAVILMQTLRPQPPAETWAVRVRVVEGREAKLTLERSVYCPPVADSLRPVLVGTTVTAIDLMNRDRAPEENLYVDGIEVLVSAQGEALVVRVIGSTGVRVADDELQRDFKNRHFAPALLDGQPMQAVYRTGGKSPRL